MAKVIIQSSTVLLNAQKIDTRVPHFYQKEACDSVLELEKTENIIGLYSAAGSGKTYTSKLIADALTERYSLDYKIAFISPLNTVTTQTVDDFPNCGLYQTGVARKPKKGYNVTLFTKNTFQNMFVKLLEGGKKKKSTNKKKQLLKIPYSFIMIDEVQMLTPFIKLLTKKIKDENLPIKLLYLTATPYDKDGYILETCEKAKRAIDWKYINPRFFQQLSKPTLLPSLIKVMADSPIDEESIKTQSGSLKTNKEGNFSKEVDETAVKNSVDVAKSFDKQHQLIGGQTIVIATNIAHAEELAEDFRQRGYSAEAMHSGLKKMPKGQRDKDVLERFKAGVIQFIVAIRQIAVGTNIKIAINIVFARLYGSLADFVQAFARVLRMGGGDLARGFDYFGNVARLGSPLQKIIPKPLSAKKKPNKAICPECGKIEDKVLVDTYIDDNINFRVYKRICCDTTHIVGVELPTHICDKCHTAFLIEEQERVGQEIVITCPQCHHKNVIETLEHVELVTLVEDREEFATTLTGILSSRLNLNAKTREIFYKHSLIVAMFEEDEVLRDLLRQVLDDSNNLITISNRVRKKSLELLPKWGFIIALMKSCTDYHNFSHIPRIAIKGDRKIKDYPHRLMHKFRRWGVSPHKEFDIKRVVKNMKTHIKACEKMEN